MFISRTSPIPTMRLPARKEYKKNVWVELLPSLASQEEIKLNCCIPRLSAQLNRNLHCLILGHVALTKIKCIPIVIH